MFAFLFLCVGIHREVSALPPFQKGWSEVSFEGKNLPQADPEEVKWRLHSRENPGPFDVSKERYRLFVPTGYDHSKRWGTLVWIDAGNVPSIPKSWETVLDSHKLLLISANRSGNPRNIFDRMRMALHASAGIGERFNIDPTRVFVAGFSGGGRVAGMLGIAWPDCFTGSIAMMGVNFYTEIPSAKGQVYAPNFIPDEQALKIARDQGRHVLVTSEKDFNRGDIFCAYEHGYRRQQFKWVTLIDIPDIGHSLPDAAGFERALKYLDEIGARH